MISFGRLFRPAVSVVLAGLVVPNIDGEGLRVAWEVTRTLDQSPDRAHCRVYGLGPERRAAAQALFGETGKAPLSIAAGYDGMTVDVFTGQVRQMRATRRVGRDIVTEAWGDDFGDALADVNVTLYGVELKVRQMIKVALAAFAANGHPITQGSSVEAAIIAADPFVTETGWSVAHSGRVTDLLGQAARLVGARWFVRNSVLHFAARNLPIDAAPVVIPRDNWLSELDLDGKGVARLTTMFEPNLLPGQTLSVEAQPYRCEALTSRGDTEAGPWSTVITMRAPGVLG